MKTRYPNTILFIAGAVLAGTILSRAPAAYGAEADQPAEGKQLLDAAREGDAAKVRLLLEKNPESARVKETGTGRTPLHLAAASGDIETVSVLLEHVFINSLDEDRRSPLHLAARAGNTEVVKKLI